MVLSSHLSLLCFWSCLGDMFAIGVPVERMDESDKEFDLRKETNEDILDCEGFPRS